MSSKNSEKPAPAAKPGAFDKEGAAWYVALSTATIERGVREKWFPAPRELSPGRVGWLTPDLDEWLSNRPVSSMLPPKNTAARKGRTFPKQSAPASPAPPA